MAEMTGHVRCHVCIIGIARTPMRSLLLGSICSVAVTAVGLAADYPSGMYSIAGIQMCLVAPLGFSNDRQGYPTIPNGNNSYLTGNTFQGIFTFNRAEAGHVTGVYTSITPPPPDSRPVPRPSVAGGTFAYDFTTTPIIDHRFLATSKPGTYKGTVDFGPAAGQQYSFDVVHRDFLVSDDRKTMKVTVSTPYVETFTYSGSPDVHTPRSCIVSGNLSRMK